MLHPLDTALLLALGVFHAGRALPPRDVALVPQQLRFGDVGREPARGEVQVVAAIDALHVAPSSDGKHPGNQANYGQPFHRHRAAQRFHVSSELEDAFCR